MKREAKLLLGKAIDSLVLSMEHFNRPCDRGRTTAVLIFLDHAFEMTLKSAILHKGGSIRKPERKQTIGFDECVRKALSDGAIRFLDEEQAILIQAINGSRDAAQHHLIDMSEQMLYLHMQAGFTLLRTLLRSVFGKDIADELPTRVLPVSTTPPQDIMSVFGNEMAEITALIRPGRRRGVEAAARLRALAVMDGAIRGERTQPSDAHLGKLVRAARAGIPWRDLFPGVASVEITAVGYGPSLDLRFTRKDGIPIHTVPEGTPGAYTVGVRRVNELDFYNLSLNQLAERVGLTPPKTTAVVRFLELGTDPDCCKEIAIGKSRFVRYSQKAIAIIRQELARTPIDRIWATHGPKRKAAPAREFYSRN